MRLLVLLLTAMTLLFACSKEVPSFEDKLLNEIGACPAESDCQISVSEVVNFEWDEMHVFKYNATFDDVRKAIGSEPSNYTEFTRKVIFTLNRKVVYLEELPTGVSGLIENEIIFDIPDSLTYRSYPVAKCDFKVYREEIEAGKFIFELEHVN